MRLQIVAFVAMAMLAGCAARNDCPRWWQRGDMAATLEGGLDRWTRTPAEDQLAAAGYLAHAVLDFDDEYARMAAAATIQECITIQALDPAAREVLGRGGGDGLEDLARLCTIALASNPRRGMIPRYRDRELGPKPDP